MSLSLLVIGLPLGGVLGAQDPPSSSELTVQLSVDGLRQWLRASDAATLFADPSAHRAWRHALAAWRQWQERQDEVWPVPEWTESLTEVALGVGLDLNVQRLGQDLPPTFTLFMHPASRLPQSSNWLSELLPAQSSHHWWWRDEEELDRLAVGTFERQSLERHPHRQALFTLRQLINPSWAALREQAGAVSSPQAVIAGLNALATIPAQTWPALQIEGRLDQDGWRGQARLSDWSLDYPTAQGAWQRYRRQDSDVSLQVAWSWRWVLRDLWPLLATEIDDDDAYPWLQALYGVREELPSYFDDGLLLELWWPQQGVLMPEGVVILPTAQHPALLALLNRLSSQGLIQPLDDEGERADAPTRDTQPRFLRWSIVGGDAPRAALLAVGDGALFIASQKTAWNRYRLAALARTPDARVPSSLLHVRLRSAACWPALLAAYWPWLQQQRAYLGETVAATLLATMRELPNRAGNDERPWYAYLPAQRRQGLRHLGDESLRALDEDQFFQNHFTYFIPGPTTVISRPALALRGPLGWYVQRGWQPTTGPLSESQVQGEIADLTHVAGPAVSDLPILPLPEPIPVDVRWLPDLEAFLRHPPPDWEMVVYGQGAGEGVRPAQDLMLDEQGLPLATATLTSGIAYYQVALQRLLAQRDEERFRAFSQAFFNERPALQQAVEAVAEAIDRYRAEHDWLPARPSALVAGGFLSEEQLLPLLAVADQVADGGNIDEIRVDDLGHWQGDRDVQQWSSPVWRIALSDRWQVWIGAWQNYGLIERDRDIAGPRE